jgi:hypothetical protein
MPSVKSLSDLTNKRNMPKLTSTVSSEECDFFTNILSDFPCPGHIICTLLCDLDRVLVAGVWMFSFEMSSRLHYFSKFTLLLNYRAIFIPHTTIYRWNMCFLLLMSISSFWFCQLLHTSFKSKCFHIKHAPWRVVTSQLTILVRYKRLPGTFHSYTTYWTDVTGRLETAYWASLDKCIAPSIQIPPNSVITPWKGLNILCRYKRVLLQPGSLMLWLTVRN